MDDLKGIMRFLNLNREDIVCFDTETTGLGYSDRICQLAIVDHNALVIFNKIVDPEMRISPEAEAIHHISNVTARGYPTLRYNWDYLVKNLLYQKIVAGYNVFFDVRLMIQSAASFDPRAMFSPLVVIDVIQLVAQDQPIHRFYHLGEAAEMYGVTVSEKDLHDASVDAILTMKILLKLMEKYK
jgi:DNA polymerase III epsilon subunit-like protein